MDKQESRRQLIRRAAQDPKLLGRLKAAHAKGVGRVLTAGQRMDLIEVIKLAKSASTGKAADYGIVLATKPVVLELPKEAAKSTMPTVNLDKLPGFSPMQLRQQVDRIAEVQREATIMQERLKGELARLKELEKEEKAGIDLLKKAGLQLQQKANIIVETEKAMLTFAAQMQKQRPGIKQMLGDPAKTKFGDKAGALVQRVAAELGAEIGDAVEKIYYATVEDLTETAQIIKGIKVVAKTASLPETVQKTAGLVDTVVGVKDWFAGGKNALVQRLMGFGGTIQQWFKGFVERTKIVQKNKDKLVAAIKSAEADLKKLLPDY